MHVVQQNDICPIGIIKVQITYIHFLCVTQPLLASKSQEFPTIFVQFLIKEVQLASLIRQFKGSKTCSYKLRTSWSRKVQLPVTSRSGDLFQLRVDNCHILTLLLCLESGILQFICTYLNPIVFSLLESFADSCSSCVLGRSEHRIFW